jgi:hypothetical protein
MEVPLHFEPGKISSFEVFVFTFQIWSLTLYKNIWNL